MTAISPAEVLPRLRRRLPRLAPHLNPDAPISELGLDSMDTVELLCAIHEEFGVRLGEDEFQARRRLSDLAETIAAKLQA